MEPDDDVLTIVVRHASLIVAGELDKLTAPRLTEALEAFVGRTVRVDMGGVKFMDSSGMSALVRAKASGIDVIVTDPSDVVRRVLDVAGLPGYLGLE